MHTHPLLPFLANPSSFTPDTGRDLALDTFIKGVSSEIMSERQRNIFSNLRDEEKEALRDLRDNDKITTKPADKGGLSSLWTPPIILESALGNSTIQLIIEHFPLTLLIASIKNIQEAIDKGIEDQGISSETGKALLVPHPTSEGSSGRFYILPKEGNPGRSIIGGNGCPIEIISQFFSPDPPHGSFQQAQKPQ